MSACRSCNAPLEWVTSEKTGKPMPLDVAPMPNGNLVVVNGRARAFTPDDERLGRERRVSHFATCVHASDWRRP